MPLLSIVTINLNNAIGLKKTFESVFSQNFTGFEFIVIDGGSTDGSREIIQSDADKLTHWVSEKDGGIYDAMNKGIASAKGQYLLFLNSGDYLNDSQVLAKVFAEQPAHDIIYGDIIWETAGSYLDGIYPDQLTFDYFTNDSLPHQGAFIRRQLFGTVGLYNMQYPIIADWIFFLLAIFKFNCSYLHLDMMVAVCNREGISCSPEKWSQIVQQRKEIFLEHFSNLLDDYTLLLQQQQELLRLKKMLGHRLYSKIKRIYPGKKAR